MRYTTFFLLSFFPLLLLSGCFSQTSAPPPVGSVAVMKTTKETSKVITEDAGYHMCIERSKTECGKEYINTYTRTNSSTDICKEFDDPDLVTLCIDMVTTETAKKTLDIKRCETLPEEKKTECIQTVTLEKGIEQKDPTVCSQYVPKITDNDTPDNMKDRCVLHIIDMLGASKQTLSYCGLLISTEAKHQCEERIGAMVGASSQKSE